MSMFYNRSSLPSDKELIEHHFQAELFHFRKSATKELYVFEPSAMWGVSAKTTPTHFSKESILLKPVGYQEGDKASTLQVIKRKESFDSFTWHTTAKKIKEAKRWGIVNTASLTGNVIAALGHYRAIAHERIAEGFISNRFKEKMWLLDFVQDRFEALEQLESLVNQNVAYEESSLALDKLKHTLAKYIADLKAIQHKCEENNLASIDEDIERAEVYLSGLNEDTFLDYNQANGIDSVLEFVKRQMIYNLDEMQGINQSLTYNIHDKKFAATRGDLNSCIVDAKKVIDDHDADAHNSIMEGHHGNFGHDNEILAYNSSQNKLDAREEQRACLAISFIEGMNVLHFPEDDMDELNPDGKKKAPYIENCHGQFDLKIVAATKWHTNNALGSFARLLANFTVRIVAGFIDLAVVLLTFPIQSFSFVKAIRKTTNLWATTEFNLSETERAENPEKRGDLPVLAGYEIREKTRRRLLSLGSKAGSIILNIFDNIVVDFIYGIRDVLHQFTIKFFHTVQDYYADGNPRQDFSEVMNSVDAEANFIQNEKLRIFSDIKDKLHGNVPEGSPDHAFLHTVIDQVQEEVKHEQKAEEDVFLMAEKFAVTEYTPTGPEMNDLLNAAARGGKKFISLYMHHIFAKHPMAGIMFTALYAAGGLSVLMPNLMSHILPAKFISFSQTLGSATANGQISSAMAAGANEAQIAAAIWELTIHGPKSWLITGANDLSADPATTIVYAGAAVLIGYAVAFEFDIPGLSEEIRDSMGSVPPLALGFAGAKIGILLVEFMHAKVREDLDQMDLSIDKLKKTLTALYHKNHPDVIDAKIVNEFVNHSMKELLKVNNLESLQKIYGHAERDNKVIQHPLVKKKFDDTIKRFRITSFIEANYNNVQYLSPRKKHDLFRQIKMYFTPEQAASLKKTLYPEETRSILRTTLSVFLGFALDTVFIVTSLVSSVLQGNLRPFNSAFADCAKRANDLKTRLKHAISQFVQIGLELVIRVAIITPLDVLANSIFARLFSAVTNSNWLTRVNYTIAAFAGTFYQNMRQRLSSWSGLSDNLKDFTTPHPADTRNKVTASYLTMFKTLVPNEAPVVAVEEEKQEKARDQKEPSSGLVHGVAAIAGRHDSAFEDFDPARSRLVSSKR
ncbi:MAG: hypothetical protein P4M14_07165 [Gammaproteobacteria bacterium]|nr:hypothetical protein [Gammaproteobacteria bacterium]